MKTICYPFTLLCSVVLMAGVQASELETAEAQLLKQQLQRQINHTLAEIYRLEAEQNPDLKSFNIELVQPGFRSVTLGAVIAPDSRQVISVTPNSNAEKLGLISGDTLEQLLVDGNTINDFVQGLPLKPGSQLQATVIRKGRKLALDSVAVEQRVPQWKLQAKFNQQNNEAVSGCGYVSVFFSPPVTKYQYSAKVFEVDDEGGYHLREQFKLPAGQHTLKVHEYIPDSELSRRKKGIEKAKTLELFVEPNKTYHIAAQFDPNKRFQLKDEAYWKPVVWKVTDSKCSP